MIPLDMYGPKPLFPESAKLYPLGTVRLPLPVEPKLLYLAQTDTLHDCVVLSTEDYSSLEVAQYDHHIMNKEKNGSKIG